MTLGFTCIRDPTASSNWTAALSFTRNLPRLTTLQLIAWNRSVSVLPGLSPNLRTLHLSNAICPGRRSSALRPHPSTGHPMPPPRGPRPRVEALARRRVRGRAIPSPRAAPPATAHNARPRCLSRTARPSRQRGRDQRPGHARRAVVRRLGRRVPMRSARSASPFVPPLPQGTSARRLRQQRRR